MGDRRGAGPLPPPIHPPTHKAPAPKAIILFATIREASNSMGNRPTVWETPRVDLGVWGSTGLPDPQWTAAGQRVQFRHSGTSTSTTTTTATKQRRLGVTSWSRSSKCNTTPLYPPVKGLGQSVMRKGSEVHRGSHRVRGLQWPRVRGFATGCSRIFVCVTICPFRTGSKRGVKGKNSRAIAFARV